MAPPGNRLRALRGARYVCTTPEVWLNLQRDRELKPAALAPVGRVERDVAPRAA